MIKVENISKKYGQLKAIENISFSLEAGEIVGFLGPNGAGKSTTLKILAGILNSDSGSVSIFGNDIQNKPLEAKMLIGFLEEDNPLYEYMYVREYLDYVAKIYLPSKEIRSAVDDIIEKTGLKNEYRKKINALSKGNRQRVGIAQAMLHNPNFLILDEPTSGLDPNQQLEIKELILSLSKSKIVLFSTHILQEVTSICSRFIIINKGQLVFDKKTDEIESIDQLFYDITK